MARTPKHDFENDESTLLIVEGLARDGLDNKDIAKYFNYDEAYFSVLVNKPLSKLSKALKKGRQPLETMIENSLFRRAYGGIKVTTQVRRFIEEPCECLGKDKTCKRCKGTGKILITDKELVQETITELPPDTGAAALWLKQKKPAIWNKQPIRIDQTTDGKALTTDIQIEIIDKREQVDENPND